MNTEQAIAESQIRVGNPNSTRLCLGSGRKPLVGWCNIDLDPRWADIVADIRHVPKPDDFATEISVIHAFEHLERWDAIDALGDWYRILKPGGLIWLEMPELKRCCRAIIKGDDFLDPKGALKAIYGDPRGRQPLLMHRWCWSEEELTYEMKQVGFKNIHLGPVMYHGRREWRDMHIEAIK